MRQSHAQAVTELQGLPLAGAVLIRDIDLPDSVEVPIAHGLGRTPRAVFVTPIRVKNGGITAGAIVEYRGTAPPSNRLPDTTKVVLLAAFGFANTVTVDLLVVP